jgi:hypothetical protein
MSVQVSQIEDVLNLIRPNKYFAVWRSADKVEYAVVEPGEMLMVIPSTSVRAVDVRSKPLNIQPSQDVVQHPRVKWLAETVGYPPALRAFQYTFTPLKLRLLQRLETGVEFYMPTQERDNAQPIVVHVASAYYVVYRSNSGRLYSETKDGVRAYQLVERGQLRQPQVYVYRHDKHRYEIGVRIPLDVEQVRQLVSYLTGS